MESNLSIKQELDALVTGRAKDLAIAGDHKRAAELLIEHQRSKLPDSHPSKQEQPKGILEGNSVSEFSKFEDVTHHIKGLTEYIAALYAGDGSTENLLKNIIIYNEFFLNQRPDLLPDITKFILEHKRQSGILPNENIQLENSQNQENNSN